MGAVTEHPGSRVAHAAGLVTDISGSGDSVALCVSTPPLYVCDVTEMRDQLAKRGESPTGGDCQHRNPQPGGQFARGLDGLPNGP